MEKSAVRCGTIVRYHISSALMVPFLLVLTTLLGAVNAKINENLHASRSPFEQRMNVQNAYPTFPSNPTYVVYKQFSDTTCTQLYQVVSFLANTCLAGSESSSKFSCGKFPSKKVFCQIFLNHCFFISGRGNYQNLLCRPCLF